MCSSSYGHLHLRCSFEQNPYHTVTTSIPLLAAQNELSQTLHQYLISEPVLKAPDPPSSSDLGFRV